MSTTEERLAPLKRVYEGALALVDGVYTFFAIPALPVTVGGSVRHMDALLCSQHHSGYMTRLFLAEPVDERQSIDGQPANWTQHPILGRTWHSWSWQGVEADQPLLQILAAHLKALR